MHPSVQETAVITVMVSAMQYYLKLNTKLPQKFLTILDITKLNSTPPSAAGFEHSPSIRYICIVVNIVRITQ